MTPTKSEPTLEQIAEGDGPPFYPTNLDSVLARELLALREGDALTYASIDERLCELEGGSGIPQCTNDELLHDLRLAEQRAETAEREVAAIAQNARVYLEERDAAREALRRIAEDTRRGGFEIAEEFKNIATDALESKDS